MEFEKTLVDLPMTLTALVFFIVFWGVVIFLVRFLFRLFREKNRKEDD